jgi:cytidine deaminase
MIWYPVDMNASRTKKLVAAAKKARMRAYAPYSRFKVGAALLTKGGKVFTGCNVENAAYGVACCAERTALFSAVAAGEKKFRSIAIVAGTKDPCPPCGICRQALYEFSPDMEVVMANIKGKPKIVSLRNLLPHGFSAKNAKFSI